MSIIVFRDGQLAADRQTEIYGAKCRLYKLWFDRDKTDSLYGACGYEAHFKSFQEWIGKGARIAERPSIPGDSGFACIEVDRSGAAWVWDDDLQRMKFDGPYFAIGHGAPFAMGAMAEGANARRAVEVACQFSQFCGMGIDVLAAPVDSENPDMDLCEACGERIGVEQDHGENWLCGWCLESVEAEIEAEAEEQRRGMFQFVRRVSGVTLYGEGANETDRPNYAPFDIEGRDPDVVLCVIAEQARALLKQAGQQPVSEDPGDDEDGRQQDQAAAPGHPGA